MHGDRPHPRPHHSPRQALGVLTVPWGEFAIEHHGAEVALHGADPRPWRAVEEALKVIAGERAFGPQSLRLFPFGAGAGGLQGIVVGRIVVGVARVIRALQRHEVPPMIAALRHEPPHRASIGGIRPVHMAANQQLHPQFQFAR